MSGEKHDSFAAHFLTFVLKITHSSIYRIRVKSKILLGLVTQRGAYSLFALDFCL